MSIEEVARELYGLVPEEFTAARNARAKLAKADGDVELAGRVQSLRKPTAGAWLLNHFVRQHADEVQQVLDLGAQLRAAQGTLAADELRALDGQRRQLTRAVAEQARDLGRDAGRRVTDATTADVEETLRSAMVDAAAGVALSTGLLTDTFSSTGIEPVDLSRVVALAPPGAEPDGTASAGGVGTQDEARPDPARQRLVAKAERAVAEAEVALREAHEEAEAAAAEPHPGPARTRAGRVGAGGCATPPARPGRRGRGGDRGRGDGVPRPRPGTARSGVGGRRGCPAGRGAAGPQRAVMSTMPRHISSVVPSPQTT